MERLLRNLIQTALSVRSGVPNPPDGQEGEWEKRFEEFVMGEYKAGHMKYDQIDLSKCEDACNELGEPFKEYFVKRYKLLIKLTEAAVQ